MNSGTFYIIELILILNTSIKMILPFAVCPKAVKYIYIRLWLALQYSHNAIEYKWTQQQCTLLTMQLTYRHLLQKLGCLWEMLLLPCLARAKTYDMQTFSCASWVSTNASILCFTTAVDVRRPGWGRGDRAGGARGAGGAGRTGSR